MFLKYEGLLAGKMRAVLAEEYGLKGKTLCVICKCDSVDDANKKANACGLDSKWFTPGCCEEMREEKLREYYGANLLSLLDKSEMAVCVDGKNFLAVDSEMRDRLLR